MLFWRASFCSVGGEWNPFESVLADGRKTDWDPSTGPGGGQATTIMTAICPAIDPEPNILAPVRDIRIHSWCGMESVASIDQGRDMPYVNIQITKGASRDQNAALVKEVTDSMVRVLGKSPDHIHIVIQEIAEEDWGYSGLLTDEWKKKQGAEPSGE